MNEQKSGGKTSGFRFGCLALLAVFAVVSLLLVGAVIYAVNTFGMGVGCGEALRWMRSGASLGEDEFPRLIEIWSSGQGDATVARIPLTGAIFFGEPGTIGDPGSADSALRAIRRATHDPKVLGIILEVDSGGGSITACDILYRALLEFRGARAGRKVVALMGDVAASGAYYVSLAADRVMAHPTTLTGSIGVMMQSYNVRELARKLGVEDVTIKSGADKDILNPFRELSAEQRAMLQRLVDSLHARFVRLVAESRGIDEVDARNLADGRVFLADEAMELKLIDSVGYMADAEDVIAGLLLVNQVRVIRYQEERSFFDILRMRRGGFGMWLRDLLNESETRLLYQWPL